jgi:hypothetical protein
LRQLGIIQRRAVLVVSAPQQVNNLRFRQPLAFVGHERGQVPGQAEGRLVPAALGRAGCVGNVLSRIFHQPGQGMAR